MKKIILFICLLVGLSSISFSQNLNGRIMSALYTFERFDTAGSSATHARTFQMLYLNFGNRNISLKTNLNLESDITESISYDPRFRVNNLYIDIKNLFNLVYFKLGRQPLYSSVSGGVFDGFTLGIKYRWFDVNGYYGGNTPAYQKLELTDDLSNDYVAGGKVTVTALMNTRIALKYINKNFKNPSYLTLRQDENLNPIAYVIENNSRQYEFVSGEISYDLPQIIRFDTRYDYDLNFKTTSKFEIMGRYEGAKNFGFSVYYNYREPKVRYNSIFSVFDYGNTKEIEFGTDYQFENGFRFAGKLASVTFGEENSQRLSASLSSRWGSLSARKTFGETGELDAISLYTAHSFYEGLVTPSLSLGYTSYKISPAEDRNELLSILFGLNYRPYRTFSVDAQGQYFNNKIYKNDFRLFLKLNYWFNINF